VKDSSGAVSNTAKVSVIINRPVANDDFAEAVGTTPIDINVLENDTDPDGNGEIDTGSVKIVGSPSHGIVNIDSVTGVATYQMNSTFVGTDHFSYTITDKAGAESAPGIVTVTIKPNSSGPITPEALDDVVDTTARTPSPSTLRPTTSLPPVSTINRDFATIVTQPKHGKLTQEFTSLPPINGAVGNVAILTGNYIYTAEAGFRGTDTFTYTITDSQARVSNVATVSVIVNLPVANDDFTETSGSSPVLIDVLANDTDPDGNDKIDKASVTIVTQPQHGKAEFQFHVIDPGPGNPTGGIFAQVQYTPDADFTGTDHLHLHHSR